MMYNSYMQKNGMQKTRALSVSALATHYDI